jgi:hypothetical protein
MITSRLGYDPGYRRFAFDHNGEGTSVLASLVMGRAETQKLIFLTRKSQTQVSALVLLLMLLSS